MRSAGGIWTLTLLAVLAAAATACGGAPPVQDGADRVVLLHGLGRSDLSMLRLEMALENSGYRVANVSYPSTERSIEQLSEHDLGPALAACCSEPAGQVHFVTHSMGGIVLRYYLQRHEMESLGRVVMLSPPNQGSELADWAAENPVLEKLLGPAVEQLGTGPASVPSQLGPVNFELGVITGDRTLNPLFSRIIPGEDDGKVSVERAKVPGMTDFLVVPHSHTYIMLSEDVIEQVIFFLENGKFRHQSDAADPATGSREN